MTISQNKIKWALMIGVPLTILAGLGVAFLLPTSSKMCCSNQSQQLAAKQNIGAINRGQQAFYLENNKFANSIAELNLGIDPQIAVNEHYEYFQQVDRELAITYAQSKNPQFKSYLGAVFVESTAAIDREPSMKRILCELAQPQPLATIRLDRQHGTIFCPQESTELAN
jgi:type IV pilus assembly protein PilA